MRLSIVFTPLIRLDLAKYCLFKKFYGNTYAFIFTLSTTFDTSSMQRHSFLKSCHFQPLASFWSHNLASWSIYTSTSLKLLLHSRRNKSTVVIFLCLLPFAKLSIRNFLGRLYILSSGSNIIFSLTALAELVFKKSFFRFKQFILYLRFRLFLSTSGGPGELNLSPAG